MERSLSAEEAAAVAAAIERFRAQGLPAEEAAGATPGPWQRAALLEGVGAKGAIQDLEGGERWLS